ncbi:helix-turn-helix domain-containing protein [Streptomyces flaveolus]|uniref:helix-turn-helix domain-containing protein n=1 Tax=Streptomyces flaveolus TaxID=67297 RepID=UPI00332E0317
MAYLRNTFGMRVREEEQKRPMDDLSQLLQQAMRRRNLAPQAVADKTGIRTPRIRAFAEDGADGPIRPTDEELSDLADALALPLSAVMAAGRPEATATAL